MKIQRKTQMAKIGSFFLLITLFQTLFLQTAMAQVSVQTVLDRTEVAVGETLNLSVNVSSKENIDVGEPRLPQLDGFQLLNTWTQNSTSSKLVQTPSGMKFETMKRVEFNYALQAQREGDLSIGAFEVVVDGKVYNTKPVYVKVDPAGVQRNPAPQNNYPQGMPSLDEIDEAEELFNQMLQRQLPDDFDQRIRTMPKNLKEAFFVQVELDKQQAYEGEQIIANWYIYVRGSIEQLDRLKFPELKGFWKEDIETAPTLSFEQEVINGVPFKKALIASHALFPIKPGTSVVDEYKIKATIRLPLDGFGSFGFGRPYTYTKSSDRIKVEVKKLPTDQKPKNFSGAVGQFQVQAKVDGQKFVVNQPLSLRFRFEGRGNAKTIDLPAIEYPAGVEVYDTKSDSKYFRNGSSYKEFEVILIPRQVGPLTIPAISVGLFDPKKGEYYNQSTEPIQLEIVEDSNAQNLNSSRLNPGKSTELNPVTQQPTLPNILTTWNESSVLSESRLLAVWAIVFTTILAGLSGQYYVQMGLGKKKRQLRKVVQSRLKKAHQLAVKAEARNFAIELSNTLFFILGDVSGLNGAYDELPKILAKIPPSIRSECGNEIQSILDKLYTLSFAPEELVAKYNHPNELNQIYKEVESLFDKILKLSSKDVSASE